MNKLTDWIKRHQVAAFFIITFVISWGLGFSYTAVLKRNQLLWLPMIFIATCGPGLAGIIVTAITNTQPRQGSRKAFWIAFLVAWFVSALVCLANLKFIEHLPLSPELVGLFTISVVPVAFVIASAYSRIPSVRKYLASLIQLRGVEGWSLLGLVFFPALLLVSLSISRILNKQPILSHQFPNISPALISLVIVKFLYQFFFFQCYWRRGGLAGLRPTQAPGENQPSDRSLDHHNILGTVALLHMASGRITSLDLAILARTVCGHHHTVGDNCLDLQSLPGEHTRGRHHPRRHEYSPGFHSY